jgi:hypothetical protein
MPKFGIIVRTIVEASSEKEAQDKVLVALSPVVLDTDIEDGPMELVEGDEIELEEEDE